MRFPYESAYFSFLAQYSLANLFNGDGDMFRVLSLPRRQARGQRKMLMMIRNDKMMSIGEQGECSIRMKILLAFLSRSPLGKPIHLS